MEPSPARMLTIQTWYLRVPPYQPPTLVSKPSRLLPSVFWPCSIRDLELDWSRVPPLLTDKPVDHYHLTASTIRYQVGYGFLNLQLDMKTVQICTSCQKPITPMLKISWCPFCRTHRPEELEEVRLQTKKRILEAQASAWDNWQSFSSTVGKSVSTMLESLGTISLD